MYGHKCPSPPTVVTKETTTLQLLSIEYNILTGSDTVNHSNPTHIDIPKDLYHVTTLIVSINYFLYEVNFSYLIICHYQMTVGLERFTVDSYRIQSEVGMS